jgi:hypothetical protein
MLSAYCRGFMRRSRVRTSTDKDGHRSLIRREVAARGFGPSLRSRPTVDEARRLGAARGQSIRISPDFGGQRAISVYARAHPTTDITTHCLSSRLLLGQHSLPTSSISTVVQKWLAIPTGLDVTAKMSGNKMWEVDPETRSKLQAIAKTNGNNKCVDCGAPSPQWVCGKQQYKKPEDEC